jgi:hypothetical protein
MSCGNLILQDGSGGFWIVTAGDDGGLIFTTAPLILPNYVAPVLTSPSFYWQLSVSGVIGFRPTSPAIAATQVSPTAASSSFLLTSVDLLRFTLTIDDNGVLATTSQAGVGTQAVAPYPSSVSMSFWPPLGLTSSISGATPLTVSADFSIWSCTLNQFINEDTTNIIVVLDE